MASLSAWSRSPFRPVGCSTGAVNPWSCRKRADCRPHIAGRNTPPRRLHSRSVPPIYGPGGWRWTSHSPTGSGPEGSSPNELRFGSLVSLPPNSHTPRMGRIGRGGVRSQLCEITAERIATMNDATQAGPQHGAYRVLARKYRPTSFDDLIGQ